MAKANVREKIVQAGLDLFHRNGFNASSVENITGLAKVPKGSFYNHFKSKEDLAVEVIDRYLGTFPQAILKDTSIPPLTRLKRYYAALSDSFTEFGYKRGCLVGNFASELADHSALVRRRLDDAFSDWVSLLTEVIKEAQAAGQIDAKLKPEQVASFSVSAFEGALLRARAANDPTPLKDFTSVTFNHLIK